MPQNRLMFYPEPAKRDVLDPNRSWIMGNALDRMRQQYLSELASQLPSRPQAEIRATPTYKSSYQRARDSVATAAAEKEYQRQQDWKRSPINIGTRNLSDASERLMEATSPSTYIAPNADPMDKLALDLAVPFGVAKALPKAFSTLSKLSSGAHDFLIPEQGMVLGSTVGKLPPVPPEFSPIPKMDAPKATWRDLMKESITPEWKAQWEELSQNPNAVKYMENSALVDPETGIPYKVSHMQLPTQDMEVPSLIEEFKEGKFGRLGPGIYVSGNPWTAESYNLRVPQWAEPMMNNYEMISNAKNPKVVPWREFKDMGLKMDIIRSKRNTTPSDQQFRDMVYRKQRELIDNAIAEGHDALIAYNPVENHVELNMLRPTALKEIGNQGTFNPNDPSIWKALGPLVPLGALGAGATQYQRQ